MKTFVSIFCLLATLALNSAAQELKNVSRDTLEYHEKFQVLKTDKNIRQGTYLLISNRSGKVLTTGFYKNNLRDSIWRDYDRQDHVVTEGRYKEGRKTGEWKYYDDRWVLNDTYDYDSNTLTYHRPTKADSTTKHLILAGKDTLNVIPERPPIYLGGDAAKYRTLITTIRYPQQARLKGISGKVIIMFTLDEKGEPRDYRVIRSIGYGCDEEALKVVKMIPNYWVPARYKGTRVPSIIMIPISFNLGPF